jgi:hypothetical protein
VYVAPKSKKLPPLNVMSNHDREDLLNILQTQGQQFLSSFSLPPANRKKRKRDDIDGNGKTKISKATQDEVSGSEAEWLGFSGHLSVRSGSDESSAESCDEGLSMNALYIP